MSVRIDTLGKGNMWYAEKMYLVVEGLDAVKTGPPRESLPGNRDLVLDPRLMEPSKMSVRVKQSSVKCHTYERVIGLLWNAA